MAIAFPPLQKPASCNVQAVQEQIEEAMARMQRQYETVHL